MAHYINKMQGKYLPVYTVVGMMVYRSCQVSYNIDEALTIWLELTQKATKSIQDG